MFTPNKTIRNIIGARSLPLVCRNSPYTAADTSWTLHYTHRTRLMTFFFLLYDGPNIAREYIITFICIFFRDSYKRARIKFVFLKTIKRSVEQQYTHHCRRPFKYLSAAAQCDYALLQSSSWRTLYSVPFKCEILTRSTMQILYMLHTYTIYYAKFE